MWTCWAWDTLGRKTTLKKQGSHRRRRRKRPLEERSRLKDFQQDRHKTIVAEAKFTQPKAGGDMVRAWKGRGTHEWDCTVSHRNPEPRQLMFLIQKDDSLVLAGVRHCDRRGTQTAIIHEKRHACTTSPLKCCHLTKSTVQMHLEELHTHWKPCLFHCRSWTRRELN